MEKITLTTMAILLFALPVLAADGLTNVRSDFGAEETANRLADVLNEKGMTIFNRIKHSEAAAKVGVELRATELIVFGNPKVGSPLMKCEQSVAIDLPQKALVWEDAESHVWISYNDPRYLQKRHGISGCDDVLSKIEKALSSICEAAATQ